MVHPNQPSNPGFFAFVGPRLGTEHLVRVPRRIGRNGGMKVDETNMKPRQLLKELIMKTGKKATKMRFDVASNVL